MVLPDGAADDPLPELDGRTPLATARIPNMHWIAQHGCLGRVRTIPAGFVPGTDVASLVLFGYDPRVYYTGRAPIEAAARGLRAGPGELIFRCNFVTVLEGRMRSFSAGHMLQAEADALLATLQESARAGDPALRGCVFHSGVAYRNIMVAGGAAELDLQTTPPHDIPDQPVAAHLPRGRGAERIRGIMARAEALFRAHPVNAARRAAGRDPATGIWLWGQGRPKALPSFAERFGLRGAAITGVDIIRGLAVSMGLDLLHVPGATGYLDTDYAAKGAAAVAALAQYDLIAVHVEATDEAAHMGSAAEKVKALEQTDTHVVAPLRAALRRNPGGWRMLIAPDHYTSTATTQHGAAPPPFCYAGAGGSGAPPSSGRTFTEAEANRTGLLIDPGHELLPRFLGA
ncbi:MAG: cofactor-independent phosphoglycerate mutase [Planctomycetota bacterium]